ncbi:MULTISPECIES: carbohydrate ABC transporter permease [Gracilibacillus]|uniref:carbohydrate ABC transporter permease n=1 Tax=Gracilibacillus TaxID=74385 RepID=UPI000A992B3E|nr:MULTISPECIES: carbohydrate ABC transporter permease [Gracilibacillus]
MMTINRKKTLFNSCMYLLLILASLTVLIPTLWMLSTALKPEGEVMVSPPQWIPDNITISAFINVWKNYPFAQYFYNSIIIVGVSTFVSLLFSSLAGYGASRFRFRGRGSFLTFLLITQMFPSIMLLIPFYQVLNSLNLIDTHMGLILVYVSFSIPFCTWMMVGFFQSIPKELDEAARIDGCGRIRTFVQIILPLSLPGLASTAIYSFLLGWNEYMFALILTNSDAMRTLPVGIAELNGFYKIMWNELMAASFLSSIPLLILFIFMQKYFISSLTAGSVKQ